MDDEVEVSGGGNPLAVERRTLFRVMLGTAIAGGAVAIDAAGCQETGRPGGDPIRAIGRWVDLATTTVPAGVDRVQSSGYDRPGVGVAHYVIDADQGDREPTRFRRRSANGRWFRIDEVAIGYTMAGAMGDGAGGPQRDGTVTPATGTDNTVAIQALYDHLAAIGGGVAFVEPRQFNVTTIRVAGSHIRTVGLGAASHVHTIGTAGRKAVFIATGAGPDRRLTDLVWAGIRVSGGARWSGAAFDFNDVLCGYGIQTRWADDVQVLDCVADHLSDSGVSIRDGHRPLVRGNMVSHVAQGIDIFFDCVDARVVGNTVNDIRVVAAINVEGQTPVGHPRGTIVTGNVVDGAVTSGIDIIESFDTSVTGNTVAGISGDHAGFPGYSFGIHLFGSPGTQVAGNQVEDVHGTAAGHPSGIGIDVAANSGRSRIVGNIARRCSRSACSVNDTRGTAATYDVLIDGNMFDTAVVLDGNATLRDRAPLAVTRAPA